MSQLSTPTTISWAARAKAGISQFFALSDHQHGMVSILDMYPIGTIYFAATNVDPNTEFGGTWVALGAGRYIATYDAAQTEFNALLKTGGAKTVTLDSTMIPSHHHAVDPPSTATSNDGDHSHAVKRGNGGGAASAVDGNDDAEMSTGTAGTHTHTVDIPSFNSADTGGGAAHANLSPYITVAAWKRTA